MNRDDFRHMHRGRQLAALSDKDVTFLSPIRRIGPKKNRALLMLHGFSSSPAVYRYLLPQLQHYDAIFCPVLPGHASSIEDFSKVKASQWLSAASEVCEGLVQDYPQVDVLGLSLGGLVACHLSEKFSLNHLYLLAPALALPGYPHFILGLVNVLNRLGFRQLRGAAGNILHPDHTEISYRRLPLSTIKEVLTLIQQFNWTPPNCPTDVFLGRHDLVVDSNQVSALLANFPQLTMHWLENSAHVLPLDNDLDEIIQCINQHNTKD